jgi:hypothetical protein
MSMRILFCLAICFALIGSAQAERPQRLSDRPAPAVKLVPAPGWRLSAVATTDVQNGIEVVTIEGDVFNAGDSERQSPMVRLAAQDKLGRDIYHWTVRTDSERIKPGDYAPFSARLESPPQDVERVMVSTIDADALPD